MCEAISINTSEVVIQMIYAWPWLWPWPHYFMVICQKPDIDIEQNPNSIGFKSLGPSDVIWHWRSWSTLVQALACCLTAPSHYLNQCWLIIGKVLWHSSEDIIIRRFESKIENYIFKITSRSPRGQWVNSFRPSEACMCQITLSSLV